MKENHITQLQLKEVLNYHEKTGEFIWRQTLSNRGVEGSTAGYRNSQGYWCISIYGIKYLAHRLAWLYVHGDWPEEEIDHINHDKADNRLCNLKPATRKENSRNLGLRSNNTSGVTGVSRINSNNKWRAAIEDKHIGTYEDFEDAVIARKAAERALGYHKNHGLN